MHHVDGEFFEFRGRHGVPQTTFPAPLALPLGPQHAAILAAIYFPPGENKWLQMVAYRNLRVPLRVLGTPPNMMKLGVFPAP